MRHFVSVILTTFLLGTLALGCSTGTTSSPEPATMAPAIAKEVPPQRAKPAAPTGTNLAADVERSKFEFIGSKITGSHTGGFKVYEASAAWDGKTITSGEVVIDMNSLYTDTDRLTGHMLSGDFFDAENHPKATFRTTSVEGEGTSFRLTGDLEMRGVTESITFPAEVTVTPGGVTLTAKFEIDRQKWGVVYPGLPDDLIKDQVGIEFELLFPAEG